MTNSNFHTDQPIDKELDDKFQRYNFSRRIAETILHKQNNDGIVIGIYGAWGEGKTPVINFIDTELSKNKEEVICIKFNPWRYSDKDTLLMYFFDKISKSLNIKVQDNFRVMLTISKS